MAEKEALEGEEGRSFEDAKGKDEEGKERDKTTIIIVAHNSSSPALSVRTLVASPDVSEHTLVDSQMTTM